MVGISIEIDNLKNIIYFEREKQKEVREKLKDRTSQFKTYTGKNILLETKKVNVSSNTSELESVIQSVYPKENINRTFINKYIDNIFSIKNGTYIVKIEMKILGGSLEDLFPELLGPKTTSFYFSLLKSEINSSSTEGNETEYTNTLNVFSGKKTPTTEHDSLFIILHINGNETQIKSKFENRTDDLIMLQEMMDGIIMRHLRTLYRDPTSSFDSNEHIEKLISYTDDFSSFEEVEKRFNMDKEIEKIIEFYDVEEDVWTDIDKAKSEIEESPHFESIKEIEDEIENLKYGERTY